MQNQVSAQFWATHTPPFGDTIAISDIEVVSPDIMWAVGVRLGVDDSLYYYGFAIDAYYALTTDAGVTWKTGTIPLGQNPFVANITATDAGQALVTGLENFGNAKTLKTTDGGDTWQLTANNWDPVASWPDYIHAFTPAKMTVIGDPRNGEFEIYNTFNAGSVWQKAPDNNIPDPLAGEFGYNNCGTAIGNTIWFGTNQGRIYRSLNSGLSWEVFQTPLGTSFGYMAFSDQNNGVATTPFSFRPQAQMYRTGDGGVTWTPLTNLPYGGQFAIFGPPAYIPNSTFLVQGLTTGGNLSGPFETWISPDRGDTWQQVSTGEIIGWPTFLNDSVGWAGEFQQLSHPTRIFQYTGSPLVGLFSPEVLPVDITLSPNPAGALLRVQVGNAEPGDYWLMLNDVLGRLLRKEVVSADAAGFETTLNLQGLPTGVYMLTVTGQKGSLARKVEKW
jgi:photosystem II stability/assembly factor-like uncharacterized protein